MGLSLGTNDFKSDDRDRQIDLFVQILPDDCIKRLLNENWDSLNNMEPKTVLALFCLKANAKGWSAQSISRFRSTFCKVLMWLEENDYPVRPDGTVAPMYTLYFVDWRAKFHERQVQNKLVKTQRDAWRQTNGNASNVVSNVIPPLPPPTESETGQGGSGVRVVGVDETPRTGKKTQGGSWSGHHGYRGLKWGQDNLKLPWKMELVDIESGVGGRRPDPPQQAEPVTMGMIECLEIFIADPATLMVAKHLAAVYLFCCYAVMRIEQAQECWIDTVRDDEFIEGYVFLDKNPVQSKMQPRPFWAPLYGITNSKLYFSTLLHSLKGVTDNCYIFRAYKNPDNSVKNATGFLPGPLLRSYEGSFQCAVSYHVGAERIDRCLGVRRQVC